MYRWQPQIELLWKKKHIDADVACHTAVCGLLSSMDAIIGGILRVGLLTGIDVIFLVPC
jgi:hypothetical protein